MTLQGIIEELREAQRLNHEAGVTIHVLIQRLEEVRNKPREVKE